jgi:hypothetical protein
MPKLKLGLELHQERINQERAGPLKRKVRTARKGPGARPELKISGMKARAKRRLGARKSLFRGSAPASLKHRKMIVENTRDTTKGAQPRPLAKQATAERRVKGGSGLPRGISKIGQMLGKGGGALSILTLPSAAKEAKRAGQAAHYRAMYGESRERTRKKRLRFGPGGT